MRKKISSSLFTSSIKREIRHFLVVVVQWRQRNVQKSVMHVQSCCFANLNLLFFWSSRCRRRRRILRSLFSSRIRHRNALTEKAWKDLVQGPDNKEFKISLWRGVTTATWGENHFRWRHHPTCDAAFSPAVALFFGRWNKSRTKRLLTHARAGRCITLHIQLFQERLWEKVHASIPKGIVGCYEFTAFQRSLKEWHERPWTYVCECLRKAAKVDSTAAYCQKQCIDHIPYYVLGLSRAHFFQQYFSIVLYYLPFPLKW